jgi:microcystin-dependent protein
VSPTPNYLARATVDTYNPVVADLVAMEPSTISGTGGSQAHLNMQPFLTLSFCIALQGVFPSPT